MASTTFISKIAFFPFQEKKNFLGQVNMSMKEEINTYVTNHNLQFVQLILNPLSADFTKWSNTFKQFVGNLSVFGHSVELALKGLIK